MSKQLENLTDINSELNMELADKNRMLESILNNLAGGVGVFDIGNKKITVEYISESFYKMFDLKKVSLVQKEMNISIWHLKKIGKN